MTTYVKRPPIFDVFEGSGTNQTHLGTIEPVPLVTPIVFRFLPDNGAILDSGPVLHDIANRIATLNANPPT